MENTVNQRQHDGRSQTSSLEIQDGQILICVYGTLMRGRGNHERFCSGYLDVQPVEIPGALRWLYPTIPILDVPECLILAVGTEDPAADVATQAAWMARLEAEGQPCQDTGEDPTHRDVGAVVGEVFAFDDPESRLPRLDALEGFRPGCRSLYRRVLLVVRSESGEFLPAWVYVAPR